MTDQFSDLEKDLVFLEKASPERDMTFYQKNVELRLLLSIAKSLDILTTAPILEGR
jgi:hypothetical protein